MSFFTYIIKSETSNKFYIGQTNNLDDRLFRHNSNQNLATKNKGPWKFIFTKEFETRSESIALERKLKSFKSSLYLQKWIDNNGVV